MQGFTVHPVIGSGYCGPTIIAAVTGRPIIEVERAILQWRASRPADQRWSRRDWKTGRVIGTFADEVEGALNIFGFSMRKIDQSFYTNRAGQPFARQTMMQWARKRSAQMRKATLLLSVHTAKSGHWVMLRGQMVLDSMTGSTPRDIHDSANKLWKMWGVWQIVAPATLTGPRPKAPRTGVCYCGCGGTTKSLFVPGHDAKLKGTLRRVMAREATMQDVSEVARRALSEAGLVGFRIDNGLLQEA